MFRPFEILRVLGQFYCTGVVDVQYRCFSGKVRQFWQQALQPNSWAPSLAAMISASIVEKAAVFCSWLVQDTASSANTAITPVVERLFTLSPAKSASINTFSSPEPLYTRIPEAIVAGWSQAAKNTFSIVPILFNWSVHDPRSFIYSECYVRACCCCKIHLAAHCLTIWNLAAGVFVVITFFVTGRRRDTFCFSHVELLQYLVCIRLLGNKNWPINLTICIPRKFSSEAMAILNSSCSSPKNTSISSSLLQQVHHRHKLQYRENWLHACDKIGKDQRCYSSIQLSPLY